MWSRSPPRVEEVTRCTVKFRVGSTELLRPLGQ